MKKMKQLIAGLLSVCLILSGIGDLTAYASPVTRMETGLSTNQTPEVSPLNGQHQKVGTGDNGTVYVSVRNDTFSEADGAPWASSLFGEGEDEYYPVEIIPGETDTIMTATVRALEDQGFEQIGAENNYISKINGLGEFDGGDQSGWMITDNDWFISQGAGNFYISDGDIINWRYTCNGYGADLGGTWNNNTTTLQSLSFNKGELDPAFQETDHTYTLTLPSDVNTIKVTPTAFNKNFQTRIYKNATVDFQNASIPAEKDHEEMLSGLAEWEATTAKNLGYYKRTQEIPVADGDVITVACGLSYWNTMNNQAGGTSGNNPGNIYTIKVEKEKQPEGEYDVQIKVGLSGNSIKLYDENNKKITLIAGEADPNYQIYETKLDKGTYHYVGKDGEGNNLGGMNFTIPVAAQADGSAATTEKQVVVLRQTEVWATTTAGGNYLTENDYHVEIKDADGEAVQIGSSYKNGNYTRFRALMYAAGNAELYTCFLIPDKEITDQYGLGTQMLINKTITVGYPVTTISSTLPTLVTSAITAPEDAKVQAYLQINNFNTVEVAYDSIVTNLDGTSTTKFKLPKSNGNYTYRVSKEGELTEAGYLNLVSEEKAAVTVSFSKEQTPKSRPDYMGADKASYQAELAKRLEDSVMLNINSQQMLSLPEGEKYRVRAYRGAWEIINSDTANIMIEPDFHYTILQGEDVISLEAVDAGNATSNWADITAKKSGTAIVEVTYDAIHIGGNTSYTGTYGAIDPARTGVFVVRVGDSSQAADLGRKWDAEFDTVYFEREEGTLSITPTAKEGAVEKVTIQNVSNGKVSNSSEVTKESGAYQLPIKEGSNIVGIQVGGHTAYQVVRGNKVSHIITNKTTGKTNEEKDFSIKQGDQIEIAFKNLHMPLPKMSGIYNPGFGGTLKTCYTLQDGSLLTSAGTQYNFINNHSITLTAYESGTYQFMKGYIPMSSMGSAFGAHREMGNSGVGTNFNAFEVAGAYSVLPDFSFEVEENNEYTADTKGFNELNKIAIYYGTSAFSSGFSVSKVADNTATYYTKSKDSMNDFTLNVTATPKQYPVNMELRYWYEGDSNKNVIPLSAGMKYISAAGILDSNRVLNMEIAVTPKNSKYGSTKIYSYFIVPCQFENSTAKNQTYIHPALKTLAITDLSGNNIPLWNEYKNNTLYNSVTDYAIDIPTNTDKLTIKAANLVCFTNTTKDRNDKITVKDSTGETITFNGSETPGAEQSATIDITGMKSIELQVESYVNQTTRIYHIHFSGENLISSIKAMPGTDLSTQPYEMMPAFQSGITDYKIVVPDTKSLFGISLSTVPMVIIDEIAAEWTTIEGKSQKKIISPNSTKGIILNQILKLGGSSNTCKITVKGSNPNGDKIEEVYHLTIIRERTLSDLKVKDTNGVAVTLNPTKFSGAQTAYSCNVLKTSKNVEIEAVPYSTEDDQYQVYVNGELVKNGDKTKVAISQNSTIPITVSHLDGSSKESTYTLSVNRVLEASEIQITTIPADATVFVTGSDHKRVFSNENKYQLENGKEYTIVATKYGYLGKQQSITVGEQQEYQIALSKAPENKEIDATIPAEWPNFRGNDENNAVVSSKTPISANHATLYWAAKYGEGFDTQAASSPILVDDTLIFTAGNKIAKLDKDTGKVLVSGNMITTSAFNITPPTYADGILFVALKDGIVQAFNADTLESLWVYHDPLKGQPNSPITYHNGYVYTGFWQGEDKEANWVCLSATDEDLAVADEEKLATFTYTRLGGFYWAGAYVCDQFLLVGTDDGKTGYTSMTSSLLSMNPITGEVMDEMTGFDADIRSSISYDKDTDRYYFTSKGGTFYSIKMNSDGTFDRGSLQTLDIGGMSTSTPVVHHGRAYIGVSGTGQFTAYSGHRIAVIDLDSFTIAYTCKTQGYPQTSGLLTTAYEESTGYADIYFIDNYTPGKIRVIKDRKGQTVMEEDESISYAPILFTPSGEQAQYAICSPIVDSYGTMYFKNDSAHMMALGSKIKEIKVTRKPKKTTYTSGEVFDATGMCVTATLENGLKRDITKEVSYSDTPLSVYDSEVAIEYKHVLYQDMDKDTSKETTDLLKDQNQSGVAVKAPVTYAEIGVYAMNASKEKQGLTIRTPKSYEYTGEVIRPELLLKYEDKVLMQEVDYTLSYSNNKNVNHTAIKDNGIGENYNSKLPTVVIKGKGSYKKLIPTTKVNFTIYEKALNTEEFVSYVCDGKVTKKEQAPAPVISFGKTNLKNTRDYEIKGYCTSDIYQNYADNETELIKHLSEKVKDEGTYRVVITGKGNYSGTITCKFEMKAPEAYLLLSKCKIAKLPKKTYMGSEVTLSMNEIVLTYQGKVISAENYDVLYKNNVEAGKATVILNGKNQFSGLKTLTFVIDKKDISDTSVVASTIQNQTYTGKKLTPKLTVADQSVIDLYGDTKELAIGKDMTISYQNNLKVADATAKKKPTVIIKGKGNYKGTRKIFFTISK